MNAKTLILAAGSSSRLGKKKQLLTLNGDTLLNRAIALCQKCRLGGIYIVLGSSANEIADSIVDQSVTIIKHPSWENGMGTTLAKGIQSLPEDATGVYVLLTDQIRLSTEIIDKMKKEVAAYPESIICCRYGDNFGAPSYFPAAHFYALRKLDTKGGAKQYIKKQLKKHEIHQPGQEVGVRFIDFPEGNIDIDYPEDLTLLEN